MVSLTESIAQVFSDRIKLDSPDPVKVDARIGYDQFDIDRKAEGKLMLFIRNPLIESKANTVTKAILEAIGSIEPLKAHVKVETETNHMNRLARDLEWLRLREADFNEKTTGTRVTGIPGQYEEWFKELPKRNDWNIQHAWSITKHDDGVIEGYAEVPKDIDPETIVKNVKGRMPAIVERLIKSTRKYSPREDKDALAAEVQGLHIDITSETNEYSRRVKFTIMSQERFTDMNQPGGVQPAKAATYAAQNPLMDLQNGDDDKDKDPGKPQPHLQKALARAFLTAGESYIDVFPLIAGKEDMSREIGKTLFRLKQKVEQNPEAADPDLVKKIDEFLGDPVFKDNTRWSVPVEQQPDMPQAPRFRKIVGKPNETYQEGLMEVTIDLPAGKSDEIMQQIAALAGNQQQSPKAESPQDIAKDIIACGCEKPGGDITPASKAGWANMTQQQAQQDQGWVKGNAV